jgi:hypothetical protein
MVPAAINLREMTRTSYTHHFDPGWIYRRSQIIVPSAKEVQSSPKVLDVDDDNHENPIPITMTMLIVRRRRR